jgi:hypothetical protein
MNWKNLGVNWKNLRGFACSVDPRIDNMAYPLVLNHRSQRSKLRVGFTVFLLVVFCVVMYAVHYAANLRNRYAPNPLKPRRTANPTFLTTTSSRQNPLAIESNVTAAVVTTGKFESSTNGIVWHARDVYLPATDAAIAGFRRYQERQRHRDAALLESWRSYVTPRCLLQVPECEFFQRIRLDLLYAKCCAEHTKLQSAFNYTMDVADAAGVHLFLDSGTLLSAVRDGESTLVPWETDIDLGIVGVDPKLLVEPVKRFVSRLRTTSGTRRHLFVPCLTKVSKNVSRHGRCRDAHYVYHAATESEAQLDTSRVEIWPFWEEPGLLVHPTRPKLSISPSVVLPLRRCRFWGRNCWCPRDSEGYLNHEYGADGSWRRPKTIHWGKENVAAVRKQ